MLVGRLSDGCRMTVGRLSDGCPTSGRGPTTVRFFLILQVLKKSTPPILLIPRDRHREGIGKRIINSPGSVRDWNRENLWLVLEKRQFFEELGQSSQDLFHYTPRMWSKSWNVCHNSLKSGMSRKKSLLINCNKNDCRSRLAASGKSFRLPMNCLPINCKNLIFGQSRNLKLQLLN